MGCFRQHHKSLAGTRRQSARHRFEDADLDLAVKSILASRVNTGQICNCMSVYVHSGLKDAVH